MSHTHTLAPSAKAVFDSAAVGICVGLLVVGGREGKVVGAFVGTAVGFAVGCAVLAQQSMYFSFSAGQHAASSLVPATSAAHPLR